MGKMKKAYCEIKLINKDNNCFIETILDINELFQSIKSQTSKKNSIEADGKIKIVSINSDVVFDILKNIGFTFEHVFKKDYGLKLMYEC